MGTRTPGWGPAHPCRCGTRIQYGPGGRAGRLIPRDIETGDRHRCALRSDPPPRDWLECLCGTPVILWAGVRYERGGAVHTCRVPTGTGR